MATFEILSKRQKFARASRRFMWGVGAAAVLALGVYFAPTAWRLYQQYADQTPSAEAASPVAAPPSPADDAPPPTPAAPAYQPGQTLRDCDDCPEVTVLPGGLYVMGSPVAEVGRGRDEGPQREVSVAPFAISAQEVTFAQWDACLAGGGCNGYSPPDRGWGRGNRPVTDVSWEDAQAYLDWLNQHAGGIRYRLPSEAEWEYAARAGGAEAYAFGRRVTATQATFGARRTTPVAAHAANAFNLYDMHGNVGEWTEDCYAANYDLAPIDGAAVQSDECSRRSYRGGGYADRADKLRAAARSAAPPRQRLPGVGFRIARTLG